MADEIFTEGKMFLTSTRKGEDLSTMLDASWMMDENISLQIVYMSLYFISQVIKEAPFFDGTSFDNCSTMPPLKTEFFFNIIIIIIKTYIFFIFDKSSRTRI